MFRDLNRIRKELRTVDLDETQEEQILFRERLKVRLKKSYVMSGYEMNWRS